MGTTADRENLTDTGAREVKWGAYGPKVATNLASGMPHVEIYICYILLPMLSFLEARTLVRAGTLELALH